MIPTHYFPAPTPIVTVAPGWFSLLVQCEIKIRLNRLPVKSNFLDPIFNLDFDLFLKTYFRFLLAVLNMAFQPQLFQILPGQVADR